MLILLHFSKVGRTSTERYDVGSLRISRVQLLLRLTNKNCIFCIFFSFPGHGRVNQLGGVFVNGSGTRIIFQTCRNMELNLSLLYNFLTWREFLKHIHATPLVVLQCRLVLRHFEQAQQFVA